MPPNLPRPNLTKLNQPNHNLPTPIEVERLEFLLSGYNHSTAEHLVFLYTIVVLDSPLMQKNYCRHLKILMQ